MISITAEEINTLEINAVSGNYGAVDVDPEANIRGETIFTERTFTELHGTKGMFVESVAPSEGKMFAQSPGRKELFDLFANNATHIN
jgi:hypothetical protein